MHIISLIIIGLSLSVDAFTLSLAYGLLNIKKKEIIRTSSLVGIFHFIMTNIGSLIGAKTLDKLNINHKYVLVLVLIFILSETIKSTKEEEKEYPQTLSGSIVFSILVSVDSLLVGTSINYITDNVLLSSIIFMIISSLSTLLGFILGKKISLVQKKKTKYIIAILLFTIIIYFLCKH